MRQDSTPPPAKLPARTIVLTDSALRAIQSGEPMVAISRRRYWLLMALVSIGAVVHGVIPTITFIVQHLTVR